MSRLIREGEIRSLCSATLDKLCGLRSRPSHRTVAILESRCSPPQLPEQTQIARGLVISRGGHLPGACRRRDRNRLEWATTTSLWWMCLRRVGILSPLIRMAAYRAFRASRAASPGACLHPWTVRHRSGLDLTRLEPTLYRPHSTGGSNHMVDSAHVLADVRARKIQPSWRVLRGRLALWRRLLHRQPAAHRPQPLSDDGVQREGNEAAMPHRSRGGVTKTRDA
jgi:hypothetical protein